MEPASQRWVPFEPEQHCSPAPPQAVHRLLRQVRPAPQVDPQQACPESPQPVHLPALHTPGPVPELPPDPVVELPQVIPSATQVSL